jgi:hypothetical protein
MADDDDSEPVPATTAGARPARREPPARPPMSDVTPPPIAAPLRPPRILRVSRGVWIASFVVGLLAIAFAFLSRNAQFERLRLVIADLEPGQNDSTLDSVTAVIFWGTIGGLAVVILVEALLLRAVLRRHGAVRWVLLVLLVIHAAVAVVADGFVGMDEEGLVVRIVLSVQLLLAGVALVLALLPRASRWFRAKPDRLPLP